MTSLDPENVGLTIIASYFSDIIILVVNFLRAWQESAVMYHDYLSFVRHVAKNLCDVWQVVFPTPSPLLPSATFMSQQKKEKKNF